MSDVINRDGILRTLSRGASTASAIFNEVEAHSLPDLMRDLRAMVEMGEIAVNRVGTTFFYRLTIASAATAAALAQTAFNERPPSVPAAPPVDRRKAKAGEKQTANVAHMPRPSKKKAVAPAREPQKRGPKRRDDSDPGRLVAAIDAHPWSTLSQLVAFSGIGSRKDVSPNEVTSGILYYLHRTGQIQRVGERHQYRFALKGCAVPPPKLLPVATSTSARGSLRPLNRNAPPRTAPSLRGTLDGMLVELNALGEVRLISSGHARLQWMCWLYPASGVMVSSNWRNDAREAVIDLRDRLAQLEGQLRTDPESTPEAAQAQAA